MKKSKYLILLVALVAIVSLFVACNDKTETLYGFDVPQEKTAELGSVFTIDEPFVYDSNRNFYSVSTTVTHGGASVKTTGGMFELNEIGDYIISFSIKAKENIIEKTTTVRVADTTAPAIDFGDLSQSVKLGDTVTLSEITVADYSGVKNFEREVSDASGNVVEIDDDKFIATESGFYTIKVTATDNFDNRSEESFKIEALKENQLFTFNTGNADINFGTRYCSDVKTVYDAPEADGGCLKLVPTQGWFYITWLSVGNSSEYETNLALKKWNSYAYVSFDVYFETTSASAVVYDFNGKATGVPVNCWATVSLDKETFNKGSVKYTAMWSASVTAVYIDNVRLEKINPIKYDFEKGDVTGEFSTNQGKTTITTDPENPKNHVLLWNVPAQWAALNFENFNKEQLSTKYYNVYKEFTLKVYVETDDESVTDVDSFDVFGIAKGPVETNKWVKINIPIEDIREKASQKYIQVWDKDLKSYRIYLDDIGVEGISDIDEPEKPDNPDIHDDENTDDPAVLFNGTVNKISLVTDVHYASPKIEIVDDTTNSGKGKILIYSYNSSVYDTYVRFDGLAEILATAKADGYSKLSMDVLYTSKDCIIEIMGQSFKPTAAREWQTITVSIEDFDIENGENLFWLSSAGGIFIDNIVLDKG